MKKFLFKALLALFPLVQLQASPLPDDQFLVIFGSSGYILFKVLDFANDHGFRYIKLLSYEFSAFEHTITGTCTGDRHQGGRYFELKDDSSKVTFLCFEEKPHDPLIIDLEKYRFLLTEIEPE